MLRQIFCALFVTAVFAQDGSEIPDYDWDTVTPLDDYVNRDDGMFSWYINDTIEYQNVKVYLVNMTSQRWLNDSYVTRSVWWHQMGIAIPDEISSNEHGFLFIDGGSNSNPDEWPGRTSYFNLGVSWIANDTGLVAGWMRQVPNQSIRFYDDPDESNRSEDSLIAYTWKKVLDQVLAGNPNPDRDIVLRCPMTKAGIKGMDALAQVAAQERPETNITKFVISGASKRGWTAWSVAATDRRVIATAPLVFSLLYFEESFMAHYQAMDGAWSFAFSPYYNENLTYWLNAPEVLPVYEVEDMFRYRTRLSMIPKFMVSATGDEFFLNQDSHYWWHLMGGYKHIMMNPNAEHALFPHWFRILDSIMSWSMIVVFEGPENLPAVTWSRETFEEYGRVTYVTDTEPIRVRGLIAETWENNTRRDYRLFAGHPDRYPQPIPWRNESVTQTGENIYVLDQPYPEGDVWRGFFIEGMWESEYFPRDMWFTSEVHIIPDTQAAPPCETQEECYSILV